MAVGVSVVIVLVAVAIVMIIYCKRRGKKSERKPSVHSGKSSDNAYVSKYISIFRLISIYVLW